MSRKAAGKTSRSAEKSAEAPGNGVSKGLVIWICAGLALLTAFSFLGVLQCHFIGMDDYAFVVDNPQVRSGISWQSVKWAFATVSRGMYMPLTLVSHMADCEIFGLSPAGHHATGLAIHVANALLLFLLLSKMTRSPLKSGFAAALFALHPIHVESVAWVAERKDVLSTFFWFLCLYVYAFYAEKPSSQKYLGVVGSFVLGLMSKAMLLTLPFTLLLLDYWPLKRWPEGKDDREHRISARKLVVEKIPLFLMSALFAFLTLHAQKQLKAVASTMAVPMGQRILNAFISYCSYLRKTFLPVDLAAYYPFPSNGVHLGKAAFCALLLAVLTAAALWLGRDRRYIPVGWLWYLVTLLPVIGIVQVGDQAMADRYSYVPLLGIFIVASWLIGDLVEKHPGMKKTVIAASALVLVSLAAATKVQVGYWKNDLSLFGRALKVTRGNWFAENNYGAALYQQGKKEESAPHFIEALRINPASFEAHINYGNLLADMKKSSEAISHYETALKIRPDSALAMNNLGALLLAENRLPEALELCREAVRLNPGRFDFRINLAGALSSAGRKEEAAKEYAEALKIRPGSPGTLNSLGMMLAQAGRLAEAIESFSKAVEAAPASYEFRNNLGMALAQSGRTEEAVPHYLKAIEINPDLPQAHYNLGVALMKTGRYSEAAGHLRAAVRLAPDSEAARTALAGAERALSHRP